MKAELEAAKINRQARGLEPADLVLKNCRLIDVFCGEIVNSDVAICGERIAGIGSNYQGVHEIECKRAYVCPGFMEGHIHIESSMLCPQQFAATVIAHGTTTVVCDPHEIANVAGISGIKYFNTESQNLQTRIYMMAPSCVPATHLEHSGAVLNSADIETILKLPKVLGLAEMMNFPGVLAQDVEVLRKLKIAHGRHVPVDGHAPGLSGKDLQAYIGSGIMSDHECTTAEEAREKLRSGMFLFIREGSTAKNLEALLPVVTGKNSHRCLLVTDDCHPQELLVDGHLDKILRRAVSLGLDPITAIQMVTINVANYFGFQDCGAVAPGYLADLVLFEDLENIQPEMVFSGGKEVTSDSYAIVADKRNMASLYPEVFNSVHVNMKEVSFAIPAEGDTVRIIRIIRDQLVTESIRLQVKIVDGLAVADPENDIAKLAVIERHHATGNMGKGFVQGFGLKRGAIASTVGHDSHNIIVLGVDDQDMLLAVEELVKQEGGLSVVADGEVKATLTLDVAGLMATAEAREVASKFTDVLHAAGEIGVQMRDPFMVMSFLALPVMPHLKMTDIGLVDVDQFSPVGLWS
ncbi:MAG: adenine deaminase [Desulfocapsa sp.]|nr:adenine deaminase [Desulfocapsa sp.]